MDPFFKNGNMLQTLLIELYHILMWHVYVFFISLIIQMSILRFYINYLVIIIYYNLTQIPI